MTENEALRAQVAMLRGALENSRDLMADAAHADALMAASCDEVTGLARPSLITKAKQAWKAYDNCVDSALAATEVDATAWLARQRKLAAAAELEKLHAGLIQACAQSLDVGFQHGMRVAAATAYSEAAQLRKEVEGE